MKTNENAEERLTEEQRAENARDAFALDVSGSSPRRAAQNPAGASASSSGAAPAERQEASTATTSASAEARPKAGARAAQGAAASSAYDPPPRRPSSQRKNAFNVLAWLAEGALGVWEEVRHNDLGLPQAFWKHAYAARRESLLAAQALLHHAVERTERKGRTERERTERQRRRGDINVDF
jgi:hypothetical protein